MKTILVPTDFSTCANNAVEFAIQSSKILPVEVTIVHAFDLIGNTYTDYMGVNKEFNQSLLHEVRNKLAEVKKSIKESEGITVDTHVSTASLNESIFQVTNEKTIDMIVMGTAGASGLKEKLWGSKTAGIIGKSQVPVMAIPLDYEWKKPSKILLATSHFERESSMLNFIFELANLYKAQVHVAVFTDEKDDTAFTFMEHSRNIPAYKKLLLEKYSATSITITHLFGKSFEEALQEHIRQNEIDMLVMVTHKRKFPDSLFHPNLTKRMAYHTKIPLLAIPAKFE